MSIARKEILFQVVLIVVVFLFYSYDRENPGVRMWQVALFSTHVLAALFIGYWLMPHFLYKKNYWRFFGWVLLVITLIIGLEELVLEQIFFSGTQRAETFPGVIFALMGVLPVITILSGFKFGWDALQKQEQIEALKSTVKESELQFLKSQINPHFLFNNLNNLYSYALDSSPKTPEIILELSGLLRYMLYECKEEFVPVQKEIEQLHNFIKLSKLQIEDRGAVNFVVQDIETGFKIAPLILIVFIENAFKHSQAGQSENIKIDIRLYMKNKTLYFQCSNNYQATANLDALDAGIGLKNVKKRLQLLYPNRHLLKIEEEGSEYQVDLSLALHKMQGK
ncbi:MAG: histidine kinase [Bacteroidota bacterium]